MSEEQLRELIKQLEAYLICARPDMAIVDRPALDQAIAELKKGLNHDRIV